MSSRRGSPWKGVSRILAEHLEVPARGPTPSATRLFADAGFVEIRAFALLTASDLMRVLVTGSSGHLSGRLALCTPTIFDAEAIPPLGARQLVSNAAAPNVTVPWSRSTVARL